MRWERRRWARFAEARNELILALVRAGRSKAVIGRRFGICSKRVQQIVREAHQ